MLDKKRKVLHLEYPPSRVYLDEWKKEVEFLQQCLRHWNLLKEHGEDGKFSLETRKAVKQFQRLRNPSSLNKTSWATQGLAVNGIVDRNTWAELLRVSPETIAIDNPDIPPDDAHFFEVFKWIVQNQESLNSLKPQTDFPKLDRAIEIRDGRVLLVRWAREDEKLIQDWKSKRNVYELQAGTWVMPAFQIQQFWKEFKSINPHSEVPKLHRLKQYMGLPLDYPVTYFVKMWVPLRTLICPSSRLGACDPRFSLGDIPLADPEFMQQQAKGNYKRFHSPEGAKSNNYDDEYYVFPWTQQGFTYDWGEGNLYEPVGANEFVVNQKTEVEVVSVEELDNYVR